MSRGRSLAGLSRYADAQPELLETATSASELRLLDTASRAYKTLAEISVHLGKTSAAHGYIDEAERLARESKDLVRRIEATFVRAMVQDRLDGQRAEVIDTLRGAIALAEEVEHAESIRDGRMRLGVLYFNSGDLEEAEIQFERAMELAKHQGSLRISSWLACYLGRLRYFRGPRSEAEGLFAQAYEWMERTGDLYMQVATQIMRAQSAATSGDLRRAIVLLRTAHTLAQPFGGSLLVEVERHIAETLFRQGRTAEVADIATAAMETASPEDSVALANASVAEAFSAAAAGDENAARRLLRTGDATVRVAGHLRRGR